MRSPPLPPQRQLRLGTIVAVGAIGCALEIFLLVWALTAAAVIVNDASFQYNTPSTDFCPYTYTTFTPPITLVEHVGAAFNLSWGFGCEPWGLANATTHAWVITGVSSETFGFTVVRSNVPVVFGVNRTATFNVTMRAAIFPTEVDLTLLVIGGPLLT